MALSPGQPEVMSVVRDHVLGQIYLAVDPFVHGRYLMKELKIAPTIASPLVREIEQRFVDDAKRLAQMSVSPRFAHVLSVRDEKKTKSVLFAEPTGPQLTTFLQNGPRLDPTVLLSLAGDVVGIFETLERIGVRRINVIPESFYIGPDGRPLYLDLQFADYDTCERSLPGRMWPEDPRFLSPEQIMGEPGGTASQVFSLGVWFCLILQGRTPFDGPSPQAVRNLLCNTEAPPIRKEQRDLPADFSEAIDLALCRDPAGRPQSLAEFRETARLPDPDTTGVSLIALGPGGTTKGRSKRIASLSSDPERLGPPPWLGKAAIAAMVALAAVLFYFLFLKG